MGVTRNSDTDAHSSQGTPSTNAGTARSSMEPFSMDFDTSEFSVDLKKLSTALGLVASVSVLTKMHE